MIKSSFYGHRSVDYRIEETTNVRNSEATSISFQTPNTTHASIGCDHFRMCVALGPAHHSCTQDLTYEGKRQKFS
jgi:hypothetical protein